jgi:hypothetical protein
MTGSLFPHRFAGRAEDAKALEAFETPEWCAEAILRRELLTPLVLDPCCGHGTLSIVASRKGYRVHATDLANWSYGTPGIDFLTTPIAELIRDHPQWRTQGKPDAADVSMLMNPPFSLAVDFVGHAWFAGIRKIVCFQRFAWWESLERTKFWRLAPPNRVYVCRERASSWRFDIPPEERTGSGTPTAHAWFVWERGHPPGTLLGHVDRSAP